METRHGPQTDLMRVRAIDCCQRLLMTGGQRESHRPRCVCRLANAGSAVYTFISSCHATVHVNMPHIHTEDAHTQTDKQMATGGIGCGSNLFPAKHFESHHQTKFCAGTRQSTRPSPWLRWRAHVHLDLDLCVIAQRAPSAHSQGVIRDAQAIA